MKDDRLDDTRASELEPRQQALLDTLLATPRITAEEWEQLHGRIARAAADELARRRSLAAPLAELPDPVVLPMGHGRSPMVTPRGRARARWLLPVIPLAAAAALLLVVSVPDEPAPAFGAAEAALLADIPDHEFSRLVSGHADAAALLLVAVQEDDGPE